MSARSTLERRVLLGAVSLIAGGFLVGCGPSTSGGADSPSPHTSHKLVGKEAPELDAEAITGDGPTKLADSRGQVTIVDFWATFCEPCRKSFPKYQELVDKYAGDLVVIAVSVDDPDDVGTEEIKTYADELNVSFPIVWDKTKKTAPSYAPPGMPTSYIIDKEGIIRYVHDGYKGDEAMTIATEVDELLK